MNAEMLDGFYFSLKKYSDQEIQKAGYQCLDDCKYFPKPADVAERIRDIQKNNSDIYGNEDFRMYQGRCDKCNKYAILCKEPKQTGPALCADCYSGLTHAQRQAKFREIIEMMGKKSKKREYKPIIPDTVTEIDRVNELLEQVNQINRSVNA